MINQDNMNINDDKTSTNELATAEQPIQSMDGDLLTAAELHDIDMEAEEALHNDPVSDLPFKTKITEIVSPDIYHIEIKPEDWQPNGTIVGVTLEVVGLRKDGITKAYVEEDKIKENAKNKSYALKLINDIYAEEKLDLQTDEFYKLHCKFIGDRPKETLYLEIEQLPFKDIPGSKFGL